MSLLSWCSPFQANAIWLPSGDHVGIHSSPVNVVRGSGSSRGSVLDVVPVATRHPISAPTISSAAAPAAMLANDLEDRAAAAAAGGVTGRAASVSSLRSVKPTRR